VLVCYAGQSHVHDFAAFKLSVEEVHDRIFTFCDRTQEFSLHNFAVLTESPVPILPGLFGLHLCKTLCTDFFKCIVVVKKVVVFLF